MTSKGGYTGMFSSDGRRLAFYDAMPGWISGDLAVYDFDTDQVVTLAEDFFLGSLSADAMFLGGSRAIVFRTEPNSSPIPAPNPFYVHDFQTGETRSLGFAAELTTIPGGTFAAFRTNGGPAMVIDGATLTPRALPGPGIPSEPGLRLPGYAGFQPTPDGKRLAYVDGDGVFHLSGLDGSPELTLPGLSGCLPDYCEDQWPLERFLPNPPRAAKFTSDGRAIVRAVGTACFPGNAIYSSLARYDLTTGQETVLPLPEVGTLRAFGPLGQAVVTVGYPALRLWSWPAPLVTLEPPDPDSRVPGTARCTYSFTDDGRYLIYTLGYLMVRDLAAGTTRQVAPISTGGVVAISQVTGISVVWVDDFKDGWALTSLMPDGSPSLTLNPAPYSIVLTEPRGAAITFPISDEAGDGTVVYRLEPGATPLLVGNGGPLAVSATQVIFRDLDGVCSYSWVKP